MARIVETATGEVARGGVDPAHLRRIPARRAHARLDAHPPAGGGPAAAAARTRDRVENGRRNARYEMDEVLFRTALSPGIREQHDEFPLIGDPDGKMVVGQFGLSIPDFLANFDGDIEEGDVLLTAGP